MPNNSPHLDIRAPPPSPADGRDAPIYKAEKLGLFLERTLAVPDLILPHRRKKTPSERPPPAVDLASLTSAPDAVRAEASGLGCFQLVNHGMPRSGLEKAVAGAAELFGTPLEQQRKVSRRTGEDKRHGFEMENGWFSFPPVKDAVVGATVGDQLQGRRRGIHYYKHETGSPVFHGDEAGQKEAVAVSFHYRHSPAGGGDCSGDGKTISLMQQLIVAACLLIIYHIVDYLCF